MNKCLNQSQKLFLLFAFVKYDFITGFINKDLYWHQIKRLYAIKEKIGCR